MDFNLLRARYPGAPYVLPFLLFLLLLAIGRERLVPPEIDLPARVIILGAALWFVSRGVIQLRSRQLLLSSCVGVLVFVLWIAPGELFPHYRDHWLLQNAVTGSLQVSLSKDSLGNPWLLACRSIRAVLLVPIIEELFWRAWLMRWLISPRFQDVRLGAFDLSSFCLTAILFATEHGPFWDVGLMAGLVYNWWMVRTRSLGDCILAHAVTNSCLCGYVIATHRWEYWL